MALTKEQVQARIAVRLQEKLADSIVWADITSSVGKAGTAAKNDIVNAVKRGDAKAIGLKILGLVSDNVKTKAEETAAEYLVNDSLNISELENLL